MMLEVRDLTVGFTDSPVLIDITLELARGEIVMLVRDNGAGKSTSVKTISGLMRRDLGRDLIRGAAYPRARRLRRRMRTCSKAAGFCWNSCCGKP
jgi:ABC-type sugar transport system ATPase subunit